MLWGESSNGFQLDHKFAVHDQVAEILARTKAVDVKNAEGLLAFDLESRLFETVRKRVFIDFFQKADSEVFVNAIGDLSDFGSQALEPFDAIS